MTTGFRIFVVIPIGIVLGAVSGGTWQWPYGNGATAVAAGTGGLVTFGPLLMILFRQKYPRWGAFDFVEGVIRWHNRVIAYAFTLVTDRYPPFQLEP